MESVDHKATLDDEGGTALDADRCGPQHAAHRGSEAETFPAGQGRSAWLTVRRLFPITRTSVLIESEPKLRSCLTRLFTLTGIRFAINAISSRPSAAGAVDPNGLAQS